MGMVAGSLVLTCRTMRYTFRTASAAGWFAAVNEPRSSTARPHTTVAQAAYFRCLIVISHRDVHQFDRPPAGARHLHEGARRSSTDFIAGNANCPSRGEEILEPLTRNV